MEIFYHGSSVLFDRFDLSHVLEGDGKVKFGYGVYLTSSFKSAAHYSGANKSATTHFVYTVEIPALTEDNHIDFKRHVLARIAKNLSEHLNDAVWNGKRNAAGDTTADLFNGFDTITQNEITAPPKRRNLVPLNT